jgi:hypothetical protein
MSIALPLLLEELPLPLLELLLLLQPATARAIAAKAATAVVRLIYARLPLLVRGSAAAVKHADPPSAARAAG